MLATLERPIDRPADRSLSRTVRPPACSPPAPLRLVRLAPAAAEPASAGPAPSPRMTPSMGPRVDHRAAVRPLRMTVRARRLLAGLALLASAAVGVVAVDVLAELIPFTPSSYVAQEAPYNGAAPGGFVPAAASSVTVESGDTLWSLAERLDPQADPREVIAAIMTLNGLDTPTLQPGQVLLLP